jgi:hypothetical protein
LEHFFDNHRGSDAVRFFYKLSRRGSGSFSAAMDISVSNTQVAKKTTLVLVHKFVYESKHVKSVRTGEKALNEFVYE